MSIGTLRDACNANALKEAVAEFCSMLIFVFAEEGSEMAFNKLSENGRKTQSGVVASALAHAFALISAGCAGSNISGGHVNPAMTFGAFIGGKITLLRGILYWISQLAASVFACFLLKFCTGGLEPEGVTLSTGISPWNAVVFEIVMTFGLGYSVYATTMDPKKGNLVVTAPIIVGFLVGANGLAGGAFDGASLNPAVSFGPAVVNGNWSYQWVYWLGPLIGAALATLVYDNIFIAHS